MAARGVLEARHQGQRQRPADGRADRHDRTIDQVGGGLDPGRELKAVLTGVANPVVSGQGLDVDLSYEGLQAAGSGLGAGGVIVYDDTACMVEVARQCSRFLYVESCGQCPPCKVGSGEITARLERLEAGVAQEQDLEEIAGWLQKQAEGFKLSMRRQWGAGDWIVAHEYGFSDWKPDRHVQISKNFYLYVVPAQVAGKWQLTADLPDGAREYDLRLTQRYRVPRGVRLEKPTIFYLGKRGRKRLGGWVSGRG